jgi:hypothetical protein
MAIRTTGRAEFIRRLSLRGDLERLIGKEVEWFAGAAGNVIGTIALASRDRGWNYVVLRKNQLGNFQASNRRENLFSLNEARVDCLQDMGITTSGPRNDLRGKDSD